MDFFLFIRPQLGCLAIIIYIALSFFTVERRKTYVHHLFSVIIICSICNLFFDMITVYTVNHLDKIPQYINHLLHVFFLASIGIIVFCTFLYTRALVFPQKKVKFVYWIPFILSILSILCLPLNYSIGKFTNYSSGLAVLVAYSCIIIYFIMIFIILVKYHKTVGKKQQRGIITAVLSILIVTSIQAIIHESLISSIGVVMLNIAFFFTVENPEAALIEELEYAKDKADDANKAKSHFLANMSHEIRTPINAMLGMDEMILREASDNTILGYAKNIKTAGNTLLSLINDILDFSKVESGKIEIIPVNYEISSFIIDIVNMMSAKARDKGLVLILHIDEKLPKGLVGDSVRIKQCLLNLLTNAIKYTDHGNVTFSVGFEKLNDNQISLKFCVKDTGIGIKKEAIERLGSPFERIEENKFLTTEGTGLGLSIVKQYLALMQSNLEIKSEYGKGTEFSFKLIQKVQDWTEVGGIEEAYKSTLTKLSTYEDKIYAPNAKVLIVDDTQMNLDVVKGLLKRTAIKVDTAISGAKAIEMVRQKEYDLIFIDHRMPEMDGVETLHNMQSMEDNKCKGKPYIMLTANAISGVKELYLKEGFTDYLSKPVNPEKLESMIKTYLPKGMVTVQKVTKNENLMNLPKIEGIDIKAALRNMTSVEQFQQTILRFYNSIDVNASELQNFCESGDIKGFGIKVHSLKSVARLIGAKDLAAQAEQLEAFADKEDLASIKATNQLLLKNYKSYKAKLQDFIQSEEMNLSLSNSNTPKVLLTDSQISDFLTKLKSCVENFDSTGMEDLVADLKAFEIPSSFAEKFQTICNKVEALDFEGLSTEI